MSAPLSSPPSGPGSDGAALPGRVAWTLYEFGGGPFFVATQVFTFSAYFANAIAPDPVAGQAYWGYIGGATGLAVASLSPVVGAIADRYGPRKPGLALFALASLPLMAAMWFAHPGGVLYAAVCVVLATALFELSFLFHNAMLPAIAPSRRIGVLSASGYAMSYVGAIAGFAMGLAALPAMGFVPGEATGHAGERAMGPMSAAFAVVGLVPLLLLAPDAPRSGTPLGACIREGLAGLAATIRSARRHRNVVLYLVARTIYYDGLTAVFAFVSIFASGVFGWRSGEEQVYGAIIIFTAAISAVIGGFADDRFGSKPTILVSLAAFSLSLFANVGAGPETIAWIVPAPLDAPALPLVGGALSAIGFQTLAEQAFLVVGLVGGLFVGPALASSRTLMARLAPEGQVAEFFGLYNLTGRATAFLAPAAIGAITQATGSQRAGLMVVFAFLAAGFALLLFVREARAVSPSAGA